MEQKAEDENYRPKSLHTRSDVIFTKTGELTLRMGPHS